MYVFDKRVFKGLSLAEIPMSFFVLGFRNGCKIALIGQTGNVLETGIINLNYGRRTWDLREDEDALWLRKIMVKHR